MLLQVGVAVSICWKLLKSQYPWVSGSGGSVGVGEEGWVRGGQWVWVREGDLKGLGLTGRSSALSTGIHWSGGVQVFGAWKDKVFYSSPDLYFSTGDVWLTTGTSTFSTRTKYFTNSNFSQ